MVSSTLAERWSAPIFEAGGFFPLPILFLRHYSSLPVPLTHGEAMFIIHVMSYRWAAEAPFPSFTLIAKQMGVSPQSVRTYARSLEKKNYLRREPRVGMSNKFHIHGLIDALNLVAQDLAQAPKPDSNPFSTESAPPLPPPPQRRQVIISPR